MKTLRVLIVEDEPLLAMDLESIVTDTVSAAVIVKSSVAGAKEVLDTPVDVAILDVDVTNGKTFDLARILDLEHIPYAFVSGSGADQLPLELQKAPFFRKPVGRPEIERLLKAVLASSESMIQKSTEPHTWRNKMAIRDDFVRHLEAEMAEIKQHLRPLESGTMIIRQGPPGFMADVTAREVKNLKDALPRIEAALAQYRNMN